MMASLFDYMDAGRKMSELGITPRPFLKPSLMLSNGIVRLAIAEACYQASSLYFLFFNCRASGLLFVAPLPFATARQEPSELRCQSVLRASTSQSLHRQPSYLTPRTDR